MTSPDIRAGIALLIAAMSADGIITALLGAVMNVYINTRSMKDREKAEELNARAGKLIEEGTAWADRIYAKVLDQLR